MAIVAYITADVDPGSDTYVGVVCSRDRTGKPFRGVSGSGMGDSIRLIGINIHNSTMDTAVLVETYAMTYDGTSLSAMTPRSIRRIDRLR